MAEAPHPSPFRPRKPYERATAAIRGPRRWAKSPAGRGPSRVPFVAHFTVDGGTVTGTLDGIGGETDPIIENGRLDGNTVPSPPSARSRTSR